MTFTKIANDLLTGPDNTTYALGRWLGMAVMFIFLILIPSVTLGVLLTQHVDWKIWQELYTAMTVYIPSICASCIGLVTGTNSTEPKPPAP